jgi:O-antigen/teichoic acid export membrane protein
MSHLTGNDGGDGKEVDPLRRHYGKRAVRRSFRHFLFGKGFKIAGTLVTLFLLARWLETAEYAAYISMHALIEVGRTITTIGVTGVLLRFLPELRAIGNNKAAYRLLLYGMGLRIFTILALFLATLPFITSLGVTFNLADWVWLLPWVLVVGALDYTTFTLSGALESFLWQKEAQYSLAFGNFAQVLVLLVLFFLGSLTLPTVIFAEGLGLGLALVWLIIGLYRRWSSDEERALGDLGWLRLHLSRMVRFGIWMFGMSVTSIAYGPGPNRLLAAHYLPVTDVATFGFAGQIANLARRFMPTRLIATMIKPILLARFTVSGDFERLVDNINLIYRINLSILLVPIGMLLVSGNTVFDLMTAGKYGSAAALLAGLLLILVSESMRLLLGLITQAVEKNQIMVGTNLVQSGSLLLAVPLIGTGGPWAIVFANLCGTMVANIMIVFWLRRWGYVFSLRWVPLLVVVGYGAVAVLVGRLSADTSGALLHGALIAPAAIGLVTFSCVFLLLFWWRPPFSKEEVRLVTSVVSRKGGRRGGRGEDVG